MRRRSNDQSPPFSSKVTSGLKSEKGLKLPLAAPRRISGPRHSPPANISYLRQTDIFAPRTMAIATFGKASVV